MESNEKPSLALAKKSLPMPLFEVLRHLINQQLKGCALVGGTALSGFYTGHRKSDDIDLFTMDQISFKSTVLEVQNLKKMNVQFLKERNSTYYYNANCCFKNHIFTIDIVLDENLFKVGSFNLIEDKMQIADLKTLLSMKAAALVSRASEKDLSDLSQLFTIFKSVEIKEFLELGKSIDNGVHAESMLASLAGTTLRQEACAFSLSSKKSKKVVYAELIQFQNAMIKGLKTYLLKQKPPPLGELISLAKKVLK